MAVTLETRGYRYHLAQNGTEALIEATTHQPDVILLDLGLPDMEGIDIIRKVRSWSNMPIIVISARTEDTDKVEALDAGADDYLTKPFSVDELLARLRVALRRISTDQPSAVQENTVYDNDNLHIDYAAGCVYLDEKELHLTPIEYKLLCLMSRNVGKVLTHTYITKMVWGSSWENNMATLRVVVTTLRRKLSSQESEPMIQTHVGIGYRMVKL
jgi:two-component system KDP operon response regulator KdpE